VTEQIEIPPSTLNPFVTNLPNGIRLIVQPETISDTVSVYGRVKSNAKLEMGTGKDGVDQALDQLFSFGTKSLDRLAFQKALDDIGANESAGTDFSLSVLTDRFERFWPTTNFLRHCPKRISKSSSRNWLLRWPANCKARIIWPVARCGQRCSPRGIRCNGKPHRRPSTPSRFRTCRIIIITFSGPT
jgi:hypothetical protein